MKHLLQPTPRAAGFSLRKLCFLLTLLSFIVFRSFAQDWQLDSIVYEQHWYYRYPKDKVPGLSESTALWKQNNGNYARGLPKDGAWIQFYKDSRQPAQIWSIRDGKKTGLFTRYFPNGQTDETGYCIHDVQEGHWRRWYENGQQLSESCYENGQHDDTYKTWYENGMLKRESIAGTGFTDYDTNGNRTYDQLKTPNGYLHRYWHGNGQLHYRYEIVEGQPKDTAQTYYYPNGQVSEAGKYYRGQRYSNWKSWYEDGTLRSAGAYAQVKTTTTSFVSTEILLYYKAGKWQYFYASGELLAEGSFRNEPTLSQPGLLTRDKAQSVKNNDWLYYDEAGNYVSYEAVKELVEAIEKQVN